MMRSQATASLSPSGEVESQAVSQGAASSLNRPNASLTGAHAHQWLSFLGAQGIHPKLRIGSPDDAEEREADRAAGRVLRMGDPRISKIAAPSLSRKCASCEEEDEKPALQRKVAAKDTADAAVPPGVHRVLASPGQQLDPATSSFMGERFGADFSDVRIHTDGSAAASAKALDALAYCVGPDIVFGAGRYDPASHAGRHLIAHELAHTLQQGAGRAERKIRRRSIWQEFLGLFSSDKFSDDELRQYLQIITQQNRIEDFTDSDNKARAAVNRLRDGDDLFGVADTPQLRSLLIREMQSGATGLEDEQAILFLLDTATVDALNAMFGSGGLSVKSLESDFDGADLQLVRQFFDRRFEGGRAALLRGEVRAHEPRTPFDEMTVERARRRLAFVEEQLAEAMAVDLGRQSALQARTDLDRSASDPTTVMGNRAQQEHARAEAMNRAPLTIAVTADRITFGIRFHVRFEDPAMAARFGEVAQSLRQGIALVWNQQLQDGVFGGRQFEMASEIVQVDMATPRDQLFYLVTVRATDTGPAKYPGCQFDAPPAGVPTSITDSGCDGGVISVPPRHISRPGILGHETLHLFGLLDRYVAMTEMTPDGKKVAKHTNVPDRELKGRKDPLGAEDAKILAEDLAFVFDTQGVYQEEIGRRTGRQSVGSLRAEADRLRDIIRLGHDPNSLIRLRENFNKEMLRSADDID